MQTIEEANWETKTLKEIDAEAPHSVFMARYQALIELLDSDVSTPRITEFEAGSDWIDALDAIYLASKKVITLRDAIESLEELYRTDGFVGLEMANVNSWSDETATLSEGQVKEFELQIDRGQRCQSCAKVKDDVQPIVRTSGPGLCGDCRGD